MPIELCQEAEMLFVLHMFRYDIYSSPCLRQTTLLKIRTWRRAATRRRCSGERLLRKRQPPLFHAPISISISPPRPPLSLSARRDAFARCLRLQNIGARPIFISVASKMPTLPFVFENKIITRCRIFGMAMHRLRHTAPIARPAAAADASMRVASAAGRGAAFRCR